MYDHFRTKFKEMIDENLNSWRGNIYFRQYNHSERYAFGLKLFCINECKTGFVQYILIFTEKDTEMTNDRSLRLSAAVVQTLMEPYLGKNHVLCVDNWYSSRKLFEFLLSRQTGTCGTVSMQTKNMPVITPLAERGNVVHKQAKNIFQLLFGKTNEVSLLSTIHNPSMAETVSRDPRTHQPTMKPECVTDYNINMRLVDKSETMISSIDCDGETLKW